MVIVIVALVARSNVAKNVIAYDEAGMPLCIGLANRLLLVCIFEK
jgi:hypothetical protein